MLKNLLRLSRAQEGSVIVEFTIYGVILTALLIGVLDFGLAYSREMSMTNAVRAGTQFALVRHPGVGPDATVSDASISVQQIRDSVVDATPFLSSDPGTTQLAVDVICDCDDGSQVSCVSAQSTPGSCKVDAVFVEVQFNVPYDLTLKLPGMNGQLNLSTDHTVRIN